MLSPEGSAVTRVWRAGALFSGCWLSGTRWRSKWRATQSGGDINLEFRGEDRTENPKMYVSQDATTRGAHSDWREEEPKGQGLGHPYFGGWGGIRCRSETRWCQRWEESRGPGVEAGGE